MLLDAMYIGMRTRFIDDELAVTDTPETRERLEGR